MSIVLANGKKAKLIDQERTYLNTLKLVLFKSNTTPVGTNVVGDFTFVSDSGYEPGVPGTGGVTNVGFTAGTLNGSNQGQLLAPTVTWVFTHNGGDFTVYGYAFIDPADGAVVYSERALTPFLCTGAGQTYSVTPKKVMDTM